MLLDKPVKKEERDHDDGDNDSGGGGDDDNLYDCWIEDNFVEKMARLV